MGCGSTSNPATGIQASQQQQAALTNQSVNQINQAFAGFNPQFYQGVQDSYMNYAMPQLQQQYQGANQALGYKLANQGLMNSSAADQAKNALSGQMAQAQQQVGNQAVGQVNTMKQTVGQEQSNLIGQAQTASDPAALGTQALAVAAGTNAPSTFAPIGSMFNNFATQYLGQQNANTYNNFANAYLNTISNPGLYSGGSTSVGGNYLPSNQATIQ